jgi:hypothetical protein
VLTSSRCPPIIRSRNGSRLRRFGRGRGRQTAKPPEAGIHLLPQFPSVQPSRARNPSVPANRSIVRIELRVKPRKVQLRSFVGRTPAGVSFGSADPRSACLGCLTELGKLHRNLAGGSACPTRPHNMLVLRGGAGASACQPSAKDDESPFRLSTRLVFETRAENRHVL